MVRYGWGVRYIVLSFATLSIIRSSDLPCRRTRGRRGPIRRGARRGECFNGACVCCGAVSVLSANAPPPPLPSSATAHTLCTYFLYGGVFLCVQPTWHWRGFLCCQHEMHGVEEVQKYSSRPSTRPGSTPSISPGIASDVVAPNDVFPPRYYLLCTGECSQWKVF